MSFVKVKSEPSDGRIVDQQTSRGGPVVHVRGDSETELDLLFSVLKNDSKQQGQTYREKNLPLSFFNPPEPKPGGSHSREGSLDFGQGAQLQATSGGVFHGRSHSSPAKLPVSLSLPNAGLHLKQGSADLGVDNQTSKYFVNNATNAWPTEQCKSLDVTNGGGGGVGVATAVSCQNKQPHNGIVAQGNQGLMQQQQQQPMVDNSQVALGPLPAGWEQGVTAEGDVYYINHNDKTTSWYDPRIPRHLQKPGALKANAGQQQQANQIHRQSAPQQQQQQQQQPHNALQPQPNQMTKPQVLHQSNHLAKQQQFLQQQQQQLLMKQQPLSSATQIRASPSVMSPINTAQQQPMRTVMVPDQIRLELQKLQKERERLVREQEENVRREQMLLKELLGHQSTMLQNPGGQADSLNSLLPTGLMQLGSTGMTPTMQQQMNISGVDPFLGQTVMGPDVHARQNSGDSGLGSCYSLPRTPEDFLGNVDALDRHDINNLQKKQQQHLAQQQQHQQQFSDFGMNPRQGSLGGLDIAPLSDPSVEPMAMDSDELVSTLTDDLGLGRDFLEMQMMDILL